VRIRYSSAIKAVSVGYASVVGTCPDAAKREVKSLGRGEYALLCPKRISIRSIEMESRY
jgi:hypothetical protein